MVDGLENALNREVVVPNVTFAKLVTLLSAKRGAFPVTIVAETDARLIPHKNNPFPEMRKRARVNGILNWSYKGSVNRQRVREGSKPNFVPQQRRWGNRVPGKPFVTNKGKLYVELKVQKVLGTLYFTPNGLPVEEDDVKPFLPAPRDGETQGLKQRVKLRDYAMTSLRSITLDGVTYIIK